MTATPPSPRPRHKRQRGWPRQADIARLAGVSQPTVSMVINDPAGTQHAIGEETRQRVWAAVEELAYATNPAARALAGGRNRLLGIFTFAPVFPADSRDFYYPFLLGIEEEAERQGYDLVLFTSGGGPDRQRRIYRNGANQLRAADGCVLLGRGGDPAELRRLASEPFPVVFVGRRVLPVGECAYVGADYAAATVELIDHLAGHGHTRVAYLGWPDRHEPTLDRRRGYDQAHVRHGWQVDPALVRQVSERDVTEELVRELHRHGATAVVAQDDLIAERVLAHAHALGLSVPADLSLAVLGDPPQGGQLGRDWTGFTIPREDMGQHALRALVELLDAVDGRPLPQRLLPCRVHLGATSGPAAAPR